MEHFSKNAPPIVTSVMTRGAGVCGALVLANVFCEGVRYDSETLPIEELGGRAYLVYVERTKRCDSVSDNKRPLRGTFHRNLRYHLTQNVPKKKMPSRVNVPLPTRLLHYPHARSF